MIKVRILKESLHEELLDEAKEDDLYDSYWGNDRHLERDFRTLLVWVYGRNLGPGQWQGTSTAYINKFKEKGKEFAPERSNRIKYLSWATDMHKLGYTTREIIKSLNIFVKFYPQLKDKSIKSYESPDSIISAYKEDVVMKRAAKAQKGRGKSEERATEEDRVVIYEDENYFVIRPHTVKASCHYGRKTKWCIAQPGNDYFKEYTEQDGKIFYFIKDDRRKSDDRYAKIAIQISGDADSGIEFDGFWDRYDNEDISRGVPRDIGELPDFFPEEEITKIIRIIQTHANDNPPVKGDMFHMEQLDEDIFANEFDTNYVSLNSSVEEGYDRLSINIGANVTLRIEIAELENYSRGEIDEAWSDGVDDIEEAVSDWVTSNIENVEFDRYDGEIIIENGPTHGSYFIEFAIESFSYANPDNARQYAEQLQDEFSEENHSNWNAELSEVFMEQFERFLGAEGRQRVADFAEQLLAFESKLKNFEGSYDADDADIIFTQKKPFVLPLRVKSFNLPVKGYQYGGVKDKARQFQRDMIPLVREKFQTAVKQAMKGAHAKAQEFALAQLSLPGITPSKRLPDGLPIKYSVTVGVAHPDEIRGTSDTAAKNNKLQSPTIRSSINITIDKYLSEEEIEATKRYIKWIDVNVDEVFEMASNLVDFDKIQKDLDAAYAKIFSGEKIDALKAKAGFDKEAFTESRKRKLRIRIK